MESNALLHGSSAAMGWAKTLVLLLRHGADLGARNKQGETALAIAKSAKYAKAIKVLTEAGEQGVQVVLEKYKDEL